MAVKLLLFDPKVNSIIWLILFVVRLAVGDVFAIIGIIDCIKDIYIGKDYYENSKIKVDKLYVVKSLTSLFTWGYARIIFLLIVGPILKHSASTEIKKKMQLDYPLPDASCFSNLQAKNYYYKKQIDKLENKGVIISNKKTVDSEAEMRRKKLENLYPEKIVNKIIEIIAGDKELKDKRKNAERKLDKLSLRNCYAYIKKDVFEQYPIAITEAMADKGRYSVSAIKKFKELKTFHLMYPVTSADEHGDAEWSEYFIIQALQPLVDEGIFDDDDFNDRDAMDNHAYRYAMSPVAMPSIDVSSDPRFALDDD